MIYSGKDDNIKISRRSFFIGTAVLGLGLAAGTLIYYRWINGSQEKVIITIGDTGTYIYSQSVSGIDIVEPTPLQVKVTAIREDIDPNYLLVTLVTTTPGRGKFGAFSQTVRVEKWKSIPGFIPNPKKPKDRAMTVQIGGRTISQTVWERAYPMIAGIWAQKLALEQDNTIELDETAQRRRIDTLGIFVSFIKSRAFSAGIPADVFKKDLQVYLSGIRPNRRNPGTSLAYLPKYLQTFFLNKVLTATNTR